MKLKRFKGSIVSLGFAALMFGAAGPASAEFNIQCPEGATHLVNGETPDGLADDSDVCMHVTGSDGFATQGDGKRLYVFGFKDQTFEDDNVTLKPLADAVTEGILGANQPSPPISLNEGDNFFLTLTNPGMVVRPDLFDPHTIHYHGFPEASAMFDGVPENSVSINQSASITYFYNNYEPGTFMWHCHVEATEHMQMGMLGSLHVNPRQDKDALQADGITPVPGHSAGDHYVYNDDDGSTRYQVSKTILLGGYDGVFHDASEGVLPLPFAEMFDNYPVINGRGYPDTVNDAPGAVPTDFSDWDTFGTVGGVSDPERNTQPIDAVVSATAGEKLLLRLTNLNVTRAFTIELSGGLKMKRVGQDARINRGRGLTTGKDLYHETTAIRVNGGSTHDVIIDTAGFAPGDYVLYTTNMNYLSNADEDFGGIMTTITINP